MSQSRIHHPQSTIALIVAMSRNRVIGRGNRLPCLERPQHDVGGGAVDGDDFSLLIEWNHAHPITSGNRRAARRWREGRQTLPAKDPRLLCRSVDLPPPLFEIRVLEIALWQWVGLLLLVAAAYAALLRLGVKVPPPVLSKKPEK